MLIPDNWNIICERTTYRLVFMVDLIDTYLVTFQISSNFISQFDRKKIATVIVVILLSRTKGILLILCSPFINVDFVQLRDHNQKID